VPEGIELLGFVEDVRPLYWRAHVVLVPLVVSGGTNLKVLEALAMQRAVVSTTVGAAGLGLTSGENILLADRAEAFAAAVLNLLADANGREQLAARGRAHVEAHYGWPALGRKLVALWDRLE
jgi:glycosyltransferase involved in cell wall biosynthesis